MFVDEVDIRVAAGDGGRGAVAFRREKFVPRGGPNGGDGGRGGSIYVVASAHLNTLVNYRFHPEFRARHGGHGQGSNRTGRDAPDITLDVPVGTVVLARDPATGDVGAATPASPRRPTGRRAARNPGSRARCVPSGCS
jgi:GTP-binding protein